MSGDQLLWLGLAVWAVLSVAAGILVGRAIKHADQQETPAERNKP